MKNLLIISFIILFLSGCGKFRYDITIPKSELQKQVNTQFPIRKNALIAKYNIHSPQIYLSDNKVGLKVQFKGNFLDKKAEGNADFMANIKLDKNQGLLFLNNVELINATANGRSLSTSESARQVVSDLVAKKINYYVVYRLNKNDVKEAIASLVIKKISVKGENIIVTLGI